MDSDEEGAFGRRCAIFDSRGKEIFSKLISYGGMMRIRVELQHFKDHTDNTEKIEEPQQVIFFVDYDDPVWKSEMCRWTLDIDRTIRSTLNVLHYDINKLSPFHHHEQDLDRARGLILTLRKENDKLMDSLDEIRETLKYSNKVIEDSLRGMTKELNEIESTVRGGFQYVVDKSSLLR